MVRVTVQIEKEGADTGKAIKRIDGLLMQLCTLISSDLLILFFSPWMESGNVGKVPCLRLRNALAEAIFHKVDMSA